MEGFDPQYDDNKEEDVLYLGKVNTNKNSGTRYRKAEILFSADKMPLQKFKETKKIVKAEVLNDIVLYETGSGQQKIHCWIEEYKSGELPYINGLRISRRTSKGTYASQEICLNFEATIKLKKFLDNILSSNFNDTAKRKIKIDKFLTVNQDFKTIKISQRDFENIISYNLENIDKYDAMIEIIKRQNAIIRLEEIINNENSYTNEVDINKFLSNNLWMFNNEYVFFSKENKINAQNILDLVPSTFDGYIDIIELKLPNVKIFNFDTSHKNYYPSASLTKAISQCMNYIIEMEKLLINKPSFYKPKATIIIGSDKDLLKEENDFLRLLNSNYHNIKIYTYQQLLMKAKNSLNFIKGQN
jgi:hypothetical protein